MKRTDCARPGYYFSTVLLCGLDYCEIYMSPGERGGFVVGLLPARYADEGRTMINKDQIRFRVKKLHPCDMSLCECVCVALHFYFRV